MVFLCGEPMTVTNRLRRQARMSEPAAAPEPRTIGPGRRHPIDSWLPGLLHYLCALEALPDASILLAVLTFIWCVVPEELLGDGASHGGRPVTHHGC